MAQFVFNLLLASSGNKSLEFKILFLLRKFIIKFKDSIIEFRYGKFKLQIPFSHDLPLNMKLHSTYNLNLGVITKIIHQKYPDLKVIDVGANIGDSVAVICNEVEVPVLCIEGNQKFLSLLEKNSKQFKNVEIEASFVGEKSVKVNPMNNLGTAYLEESEEGITVLTMSEVLAKHTSFTDAKLLKIDTDGFDNKIIRASKEFLSKTKPIIFFEYDPYYLAKQNEKGIDIFDFLEELNYTSVLVFDNFGKYLTLVNLSDKKILNDLHQQFDRNGSVYMDLCVCHLTDDDLAKKIENYFSLN